MRLIDADALIPMIKYATIDNEIGVFPIRIGFDAIVKVINEQPTIEAVQERKKGRWVRHYTRPNVYADLFWHCSVCGYKNENNYAHIYHKFCPNCGAHMEGAE